MVSRILKMVLWLMILGIVSPFAGQAQQADRRLFHPPGKLPSADLSGLLALYRNAPAPATLWCGCRFDDQGRVKNETCRVRMDRIRSLQWQPVAPLSWFSQRVPETTLSVLRRDLHTLFPAVPEFSACGTVSGSKEPRPGARGDLARAWFYMSFLYKIKIEDGLEDRLRMWHLLDPPDAWEEKRNTLIEDLQGNRNPFIDHPALVERVPNF